MDVNESIQATHAEKIYDIAHKNGIIQSSWEDFDIEELMNRGELLIVVSKLDRWKDTTG
jgi:hypothetical protein